MLAHTKIVQSAAALLRLVTKTAGRSDTALGALYRRLSSRAGKSRVVTATARARKIAVSFYNTFRLGMSYVPLLFRGTAGETLP